MRSTQVISVIIPLFNEEKRFPKSFPIIDAFFTENKISVEYILVDDGSTDATAKRISRLTSKYPIRILGNDQNRGKGAALKRGVEAATGKFIMFTDADLSTPIAEFKKLFPYVKKYDMVIGSRRLHESDVKISQPLHRKILGSIFYFLFSTLFTNEVKDTNCGFKMYRAEVAKNIYQKIKNDRWGFDAEVIYLALKLKYKIAEVPVIWLNDPLSRVSSVRASFETLKELAMIKINDWSGRYSDKSAFQTLAERVIGITFTIFFSIIGKPQSDKHLTKAVDLYSGEGFSEIFSSIRIWDAPFEAINRLVPNKGTILDLGSGDGLLANYLALSQPKRVVYGFEINPDRLNISDRKVKNTYFRKGDLTHLKLPKNNCMLLVHVLHHLPNRREQEKLLVRCFSQMDTSGRLIIVEIARKPYLKYAITWLTDAFIVPILFEKRIFNKNFFYRSTSEWQTLLKRTGFSVQTYSAHSGKPFSHVIFVATKK